MKRHKRSLFSQIVILTLTVFLAAGCAKKKEEDSTDEENPGGGGATPTPTLSLSGTFRTPCVAVSGMAMANGTHYRTSILYGSGGVADQFQYDEQYYTSSGCTTLAYNSSVQGTFVVGSPTTTPTDGFNITYTVTDVYVLGWNPNGGTLSSGCTTGVNWSTSGSNYLGYVNGTFNCAGMAVAPPGGTYYNVVVLNGTTLNTGITTGDNPGVTPAGSVGTTVPLTFTKQ